MSHKLLSSRFLLHSISTLSLILALGCGGGGGSNPTGSSGNGSGSGSGSAWTANVFQPESSFKDLCQTPRTGNDQFSGNPFPDRSGSTLDENNWLRSWSDNTYLWYDEIVDKDPGTFSTTETFFEQLKTTQTTPSGQLRDHFHFTYVTEDWEKLNQSGISAGYGIKWQILQPSPPRRAVVAFSEPSSPAALANIFRGAEIVTVDNVDFVNAGTQADVDIINAAFFPATVGESHTFVIKNIGEAERSVTLVSAEITSSPVQNVNILQTASGNVGYMLFNSHIATAEEQLIDGINQLKAGNVTDLVLDLRYNGGGLLAIASQLAYMIAGPTQTNNQVFDKTVFNNKHTTINPVTGQALTPTPFYDTTLGFSVTQGAALPTLNLSRVFILSTSGTCSASEAIINGLRGVGVEVILIGSTTCGKPYGFYPTDNCGTTYFTIQFRGENAQGFGDYSDGFSPENTAATIGEPVTGCSVADDYTKALGDPTESLVAAALGYRVDGSCPTPTAKGVAKSSYKSQQNGAMRTVSPFIQAVINDYKFRQQK